MTKMQTGTAGKGGVAVEATPARRLGRGLSSLLGTPVKVDVSPAAAEAKLAARGAGGGGGAREAGGAESAPKREEAARAASAMRAELNAERAGAREEERGARIVMIEVGHIVPNRYQPRRQFDEAGLNELAASIRAAGVVQPVLVRKHGEQRTANGERQEGGSTARSEQRAVARVDTYELVAGERRWRASRIAGVMRIPAVVAELSDEQAAEWALIENVQRADLQPLEQAHALRRLCETFGHTHAQAAEKLGLDRTTVTNLLRLTELEPEIQGLMEKGKLSGAHAKVLLGMMGGAARVSLAKVAAEEEWSVRELTVSVIASAKSGKPAARPAVAGGKSGGAGGKSGTGVSALQAAGLEDLQKQLAEHLGTKVQIRVRRGGKSGEVVVKFYDLDHFDGLMGRMGFVMR
ncbi:MAG: ParB/RepB/Spo0J family partition protein [Phycisphaerales bacterium]|nr:ParB/RepB/Spo0J family partition protein [Phycisphaerales bacterium]